MRRWDIGAVAVTLATAVVAALSRCGRCTVTALCGAAVFAAPAVSAAASTRDCCTAAVSFPSVHGHDVVATPAVHVLQPGGAIADLLPRIRPGDEVVLAPGRHAALDLSRAQGTAERPIVVRGTSVASPALIEGGAFAVRLDGAVHVVLKDLALRGGTIAAIVADAAPCRNVRIERVAALRTDGRDSDAIRFVGAEDVAIERSHLEHAGVPDGAAVRLRNCRRVRIADVRVVGAAPSQAAGIVAEGGCDLTIEGCRVEGGARIGVLLTGGSSGSGGADGDVAAPPGRISHVVVARCVFLRCAAAWSIAGADDVVIERCTVSEPDGDLMKISGDVGATKPIVLRRNLLHWLPNQVARLADVPAGLPPSALRLEENLWWSADLAEARAAYGAFPGAVAAAQVVDVDPRFGEQERPMNRAAERFGAAAAATSDRTPAAPPPKLHPNGNLPAATGVSVGDRPPTPPRGAPAP